MKENLKKNLTALVRWLPHRKIFPNGHPTVAQKYINKEEAPNQNQVKESKIILITDKKSYMKTANAFRLQHHLLVHLPNGSQTHLEGFLTLLFSTTKKTKLLALHTVNPSDARTLKNFVTKQM